MAPKTADTSRSSTVRREAGHASLYVLSTALSRLGIFLLIPLLWHKLTPADFGIIGVTEILCSFLGVFWGLSLDVGITRFYHEWPEADRKRRLGTLWIVAWGSALVLGGFSILVLRPVSPLIFPDVTFYPCIFLGLTHGIMATMRQVVFATLRIKQLPRVYLGYSIAIFAISTASNILFVGVFDWGILGYFIAWNATEAILLAACACMMLRFATLHLGTDGLKEVMAFALPLVPNNVIAGLSQVMDRYLLQRYASLEALGLYTLCLKFANVIVVLHDALKMSFAPFIFKTVSETPREAPGRIAGMRMYYMIPLFPAAFAMVLFIRNLVRWIGNPAYFPVADGVPLLVGPAVLQALFTYFACGFALSKRTDKLWIPTLTQLALILAGGLTLTPLFQLNGIIAARYLTMAGFLAAGIILSQKYYPIPFPAGKLAVMGALLGLAIGLSQAMPQPHGVAGLGLNVALFAAFTLATVVTATGVEPLHGTATGQIRTEPLKAARRAS